MTTVNHTPEPWRVDMASIGLTWTDSISISDATGAHVAHLTRGYEDGPSLANAAHIVRCVNAHDDLVAALREAEIALKHCSEFFNNFPEHGGARLPASAYETVRAALAKAEG